jgi:hypothetical protein
MCVSKKEVGPGPNEANNNLDPNAKKCKRVVMSPTGAKVHSQLLALLEPMAAMLLITNR